MYYLIGKTLKHSKSKEIHALISDIEYDYLELDDLSLLGRDFSGSNVTIPYKEEIIPYLDEVEERAKRIGAVNTVVNNGKLTGYNTDYDGFLALLNKYDIDVYNKNCLIIGTGGSSKTVNAVLEDLHAGSIEFSSRSGMTTDMIEDKYDIIINTTPVGMYPDEETILDLREFHLEACIDLVYNPLRTGFLLSSKCKAVNGLYMLVAQAVKAQELFLGKPIDKIDEVYEILHKRLSNIVLIGMPMSGKSTIGKEAAEYYSKEFIDTDTLCEEFGTIEELFDKGIFRDIESKVVDSLKWYQDKVISTGGGVILKEDNMRKLQRNGVIAFIERPIGYLLEQDSANRPLLRESGSLERLFFERLELYRKYADIVITDNWKEELDAYFSIEWS